VAGRRHGFLEEGGAVRCKFARLRSLGPTCPFGQTSNTSRGRCRSRRMLAWFRAIGRKLPFGIGRTKKTRPWVSAAASFGGGFGNKCAAHGARASIPIVRVGDLEFLPTTHRARRAAFHAIGHSVGGTIKARPSPGTRQGPLRASKRSAGGFRE